MNEHRKKVILDVDTGTDDALAILMALTDPGLEVIGITVTQGNQPLENCVDNTLRVVDLLGADVPVYAGCSAPMVRSLSKGRMAQNPENVVSAEVDGKPVILLSLIHIFSSLVAELPCTISEMRSMLWRT